MLNYDIMYFIYNLITRFPDFVYSEKSAALSMYDYLLAHSDSFNTRYAVVKSVGSVVPCGLACCDVIISM